MAQTKKGILGRLRGKGKDKSKDESKGKKEKPADETLCSDETTFQQVSEAFPNTQNTTCPNNQCGRVFDKPLELIDLADPSSEHSLVCPYCLSKLEPVQLEITEQEEVTEQEVTEEVTEQPLPWRPQHSSQLEPVQPEQEEVTEAVPSEETQGATKEKEEKCPHKFGYLGKRPKNVPIPEFCLTCPKMIECCTGKH